DSLGGYRRQRDAAAKEFLWLCPQGGREKLADDYRHGLDRHRKPQGRGDIRGGEGNRQGGVRRGPRVGGEADLAPHRQRPQRDPPRGDADGSRGTPPRVAAASRAERDEPPRRDGTPYHPAAQDEEQCRVPDEPEGHLIAAIAPNAERPSTCPSSRQVAIC